MIGDRNQKQRFMCDLMNVILEGEAKQKAQTEEELYKIPYIPNAVEGVSVAVKNVGADDLIIVSRIDKEAPWLQGFYLDLLRNRGFFKETGVRDDPDHVKFCHYREEKGIICYVQKITIAMDDRTAVHWSIGRAHCQKTPPGLSLQHMRQMSDVELDHPPHGLRRILFRPDPIDRRLHEQWPDGITIINSWPEVLMYLGWRK
ncbi:MAG: hypothetical protein A3I29_00800 [Candidatus Magasanikbacteria bacterium RIFCSPLOWO2_02_FULL_44_11]|nr:MAG: hypothetical protein A3I29_00800 [Candidatus Magasanikbacteria bacterium RIFCSPLOWO2_02_FULL_44_11]